MLGGHPGTPPGRRRRAQAIGNELPKRRLIVRVRNLSQPSHRTLTHPPRGRLRTRSRPRPDSAVILNRRAEMRVAVPFVVLLAAVGLAPASRTRSPPAPSPSGVYLGVACHRSGVACGRVGVAVWLPRAADHVEALVLGARVRLATTRAGSGRYGFRRYWTGFRRVPPRSVHPGRFIVVRVTVTLRGMSRPSLRSVYLSAGWG